VQLNWVAMMQFQGGRGEGEGTPLEPRSGSPSSVADTYGYVCRGRSASEVGVETGQESL
jgi:hypothetical protein